MPVEIVISTSGGVVESVRSSQPAILTIVDWNAEPMESDVPGFVSVEAGHGSVRALVSRCGAAPLADYSLSDRAIELAEERGIISRIELTPSCYISPSGDLATLLAALRHWQMALITTDGAITQLLPHFKDVAPLTTLEIDQLYERLDLGGPDFTPEELETWRTTWEPRSGSAEM